MRIALKNKRPTRNRPAQKRKKTANKVNDLPYSQRGLPNNRWGGHRNLLLRNIKGTFGPANKGRSYTAEEIEEYLSQRDDFITIIIS